MGMVMGIDVVLSVLLVCVIGIILHIQYPRFLRNPLYVLGAVVLLQVVLNPIPSFWYGVLFLIVIAYVQNVSYSLQSRAGTRNSNAFHALTAVFATLVFFVTLRYLYKDQMPLMLLPTYLFATVFGSLHGKVISQKIEKHIGAKIEAPKNQPQLMRFWPSIVALLGALILQIVFVPSSLSPWIIAGLALLTLVDNFSFAVFETC